MKQEPSFSRKILKKNAWANVRRHFFLNIVVLFLVTIVVRGGYFYATETVSSLADEKVGVEDAEQVLDGTKSNAEVLEDLVNEQNLVDIELSADTLSKKYTRGVLSVFVNEITSSRSIGFGILNGVNTLAFDGKVGRSIIIFLMMILELLYQIFVKNTIIIGKNRYFLEHRRYSDTKMDRLMFLPRYGMTRHAAGIMVKRYFLQLLWMCTIVMGPVKYYEYKMIPYILAENPAIPSKEAFALSKKMSQGRKWEMFLLDLSMLGWLVLGALTFNVVTVFWLRPYMECINAELYMTLREKVDSPVFCDDWLLPGTVPFGTLLVPVDETKDAASIPVAGGYPDESYILKEKEHRRWLKIDYRKDYSLTGYVLLFFSYSFIGWLWEVCLHLATDGTFVNRGVLFGPWLPIYGSGAVLILFCLKPLRDKPFRMFLATMALCGTLEYTTSWALEEIFHETWWNYQGYFLNLNGRICLEGLLVFGLGGQAFTYVVSPLLDNLFERIPKKKKEALCITLIALFLGDAVHSLFVPNTGAGITTVTKRDGSFSAQKRPFLTQNNASGTSEI